MTQVEKSRLIHRGPRELRALVAPPRLPALCSGFHAPT
nr:MAG TPA: hypothetical protein [Caudoviricetes sp.]